MLSTQTLHAQVFVARPAAEGSWSLAALVADLPSEEQQRPFRHVGDRVRFVLSRAALRRLVAAETGQTPSTVELVRRPDGGLDCPGGPFLSLSHSGDWAAAAISSTRIGVDLQAAEPALRDPLVQERSCSAAEWHLVQQEAGLFHQLWVRKEAVLKSGVDVELRDLEVLAEVTHGRALHDLAVPEGLRAALAVEVPTGAPRVRIALQVHA